MNDIGRFLDEKGRVHTWASKREMKLELLKHISTKFESGRFYTEKEVNARVEDWHTFGDYFLIRRELVNNGLLTRTRSGSRYWKDERETSKDRIEFLQTQYDIGQVNSIFRIAEGYGSHTCYVATETGEYIFKDMEQNPMNHPENEGFILDALREHGIPVSTLQPARNGEDTVTWGDRTCHVQRHVEGKSYPRNTAPQWLLQESAHMLGRIHHALEGLPSLPTGISQGFFDYLTPQRAQSNHASTLKMANERGDAEIAEAVKCKLEMLGALAPRPIDVGKMTCKNTHGDYKLSQLICGKERIHAVIDFTSACVHPVCWELIRSFSLTDEACRDGDIHIGNFKQYLACYLEHASLNAYDLEMMPYMFFYQNLVSDYFGQYYATDNMNRHHLLEDAFFSVKLCKWLESNIDKLDNALASGL